ncbi:hypothetical protein NQ315_006910 [Exocentrus adspersus]|uniref:JmjC domain-containing protein n=1 Tax=Exocentrus adspersus TaxID=1586481 RepID=A0AAV8WD61_9CUCU|nr:hypothetical protein NQ315_006910 [Exocentrus adspersus]
MGQRDWKKLIAPHFRSLRMNTVHEPAELQSLILNSAAPLLFRKIVTSNILKWTLEDWARVLGNEILEFRIGKYEYSHEPQWERKTATVTSSFKHFLECAELEPELQENRWLYFDYKYLKYWFTSIDELRNNISWVPLGFPDITADECTIWIGTKGAHTPCHIDTYGFNLIFQVYGKKLWIIAPPEENLKPTRVPYEESSVYSKLNFFSPNVEDFKGISNVRKIILNPGEVLYLPHKWWHYVENLETAISLNVWIPLPEDDEERLAESVVQLFVKQLTSLSQEVSDHILNPNMRQLILDSEVSNMLETVNNCKTICKDKLHNKKTKADHEECTEETDKFNEGEVLKKYPFVEKIPRMSPEAFNLFLKAQRERFKNEAADSGAPGDSCSYQNGVLQLFNVLTDDDVISLISEKLLRMSS